MADCPGGLLWDVMEMRAYVRTREMLADAAKAKGGEGEVEITPMVELVQTIQAEIDAETIADLTAEIEEGRRRGGNG
jgi:hypothetical protein